MRPSRELVAGLLAGLVLGWTAHAIATPGPDVVPHGLPSVVVASSTTVRPAPRPSRSTPGRSSPARPAGPWHHARASYTNVEPAACWDGRGRHPFPAGLTIWTAHKTLPCGTILVVRFRGNLIRVPVWDRGPYVPGRDLDLSRSAFARLAPLRLGVIDVAWRVA